MKSRWLILSAIILCALGMYFILHPVFHQKIDTGVRIDEIIIEKKARRLLVYSKKHLTRIYKISLGKNPIGAKEFEGDNKTPEGIYIINEKNPNSSFHKSLGISYPNSIDIQNASKVGKDPGGLIKIHGLKNGLGWIGRAHLIFDWTAGCIAMTDEEIDELYNAVQVGTVVEIRP